MSDITIDQVSVDEVKINDLTTVSLKGTGVWDKLLQTMQVQLDEQFRLNRITATSYAEVYTQLFQATLQSATAFLLAKERQALELKGLELQNELTQAQIDQIHDQMQKTPYEIAQLEAGTAQTLAQTEDIKVKTEQDQFTLDYLMPLQKTAGELENAGRTLSNETAQYNLNYILPAQFKQTEAQTDGVIKDTALKDYQLTYLYPAQLAQTTAQTENVTKDTALKQYQIDYLYPAQLENANKQNELLAAQIANQTKQLDLLAEQISQAKAQTAYYDQKTITEEAQVDPSVIKDGSVIATQLKLMNGQYDGYLRNAEQAVLQVLANTWNVRRQTDEDTSANSTNLLDDATVGKMIQKALAGVDLTVTPS